MGIIISNDREKIITILKKNNDRVFKITKEVIYAIPESNIINYSNYNDFLKFAKEHPDKVFTNYYKVLEKIKDVEEL